MKTHTVYGKRLQVTCRALGIAFAESGSWVKRGGFANFKVDGVKLAPEDAAKLRAVLSAKDEKQANKRATAGLRREKRIVREAKECAKIAAFVAANWSLPCDEVERFSSHANATASGRVVRSRTTGETWETRVRMALVAWCRHQHTSYDSELRRQRDELFAALRVAKEEGEFFDNESGELLTGATARDAALASCKFAADELHAVLQPKFTAEAVKFLASIEIGAVCQQSI